MKTVILAMAGVMPFVFSGCDRNPTQDVSDAVYDYAGKLERKTCQISLKTISYACEVYRINNKNMFPRSMDDLIVPNKKGFSCIDEECRLDPWGTEYKITEYRNAHHARRLVITSAGPDRRFGTQDDLSYPDVSGAE